VLYLGRDYNMRMRTTPQLSHSRPMVVAEDGGLAAPENEHSQPLISLGPTKRRRSKAQPSDRVSGVNTFSPTNCTTRPALGTAGRHGRKFKKAAPHSWRAVSHASQSEQDHEGSCSLLGLLAATSPLR